MDCPFVSEISSPNCEYCHEGNSTFFCYKCGYVSYCSNECKVRDQNFHKYECIGYNFFWLNILNVKMELRTLIRCLGFMKKEIFDKFNLRLDLLPEMQFLFFFIFFLLFLVQSEMLKTCLIRWSSTYH